MEGDLVGILGMDIGYLCITYFKKILINSIMKIVIIYKYNKLIN